MSSSKNNTIYKKTSFLAGNNSEFINEFYADYISDPHSLPESWRKFFEGLSDDEKLVHEDLKGPSWSPNKKIRKLSVFGYIALAVFIIQIMLGGWTSTNYAALACSDFPKCHGFWWPQMDFYGAFIVELATNLNYEFGRLDSPARVAIHFTHRVWAIVATVMIFSLAILSWRYINFSYQKLVSTLLIIILFFQILLGILNIKMSLPLYIAVAHNGNAALLLILSLIHI